MGGFRNSTHLIRAALFCVVGLIVFAVVRSVAVPKDFGIYGHYRAGALDDARAKPIVFAGQKACGECHTDIVEMRKTSKHQQVSCEVCHGPLAKHASGDDTTTPKRPDGRTACLTCHQKNVSKPAAFPQIVLKDHADEGPCIACHQPHNPKIS